MTEPNDELMDRLERLDPATADLPPTPGSTRFISIEERAMNATTEDHRPGDTPGPGEQTTGRRMPRASILAVAAAAIIAVVALGALALNAGSPSTAAAAVRTASANTAEVESFRLRINSDNHAFLPGGEGTGEVSGDSMHLVAGNLEFIRVGGTEWAGVDGVFEMSPAEDSVAPFGEASSAVVTAALASEQVTDEGVEVLGGVETTHYVVHIDEAAREALAAVPSSAQFWFVGNTSEEIVTDESGQLVQEPRRFGFLEDADSISLWVADDLIHQISVRDGSSTFTYTFSDFNADITITPPE